MPDASACKRILWDIVFYRKTLIVILVPIIFLPLPLSFNGTENERAVKCAYTVLIMAAYWVFEVMPIAITALLPIFMFPLTSVMSVGDTASPYLSQSNFLFIGGLMIAIAVEEVNLHKRLALRVLLMMGSQPKFLMLGFMLVTAFLSMWMSNTATTAMMLPIALAVIDELLKFRKSQRQGGMVDGESDLQASPNRVHPLQVFSTEISEDGGKTKKTVEERSELENLKNLPKEDVKLAKAILLSLCYSANIGGTATLTGTVPNVVAVGALEKSHVHGVTYANWMGFQLPAAIIFLLITWFWLQLLYFSPKEIFVCRSKANKGLRNVLREKYVKLGRIRFGEYLVGFLYVTLVILWIFRAPQFMPGWGSLFPKNYIKDAVPSILIAVLCFVLPRDYPDFYCCPRRNKTQKPRRRRALMTWDSMKKFPWDVILILGGGFSMAKGVENSGLSDLIAVSLKSKLANQVSPTVFCVIAVILITFFTEFTSNTSTANIFVPILISIARGLNVSPLYFALPVTIACSFAFMLPVATPPNAIVFGAKILAIKDMVITGFCLNWFGIAIALLNANFYTPLIFDMSVNSTDAMSY